MSKIQIDLKSTISYYSLFLPTALGNPTLSRPVRFGYQRETLTNSYPQVTYEPPVYDDCDEPGYKLSSISWPTITINSYINLVPSGIMPLTVIPHPLYFMDQLYQRDPYTLSLNYDSTYVLNHEKAHESHDVKFWTKHLQPLVDWSENYYAGFFLEQGQASAALKKDFALNLKSAFDSEGVNRFKNAEEFYHTESGYGYAVASINNYDETNGDFEGDLTLQDVDDIWRTNIDQWIQDYTPSYPIETTSGTGWPTICCFLAGTLIATPTGERPIESLQPGDLISTAEGPQPVRFLARSTRSIAQLQAIGKMPIRINQAALGCLGPDQDIFMSPSHAIHFAGSLVEAGALINGTSIQQLDDWPEAALTYYNIELERHGLITANGLLAESYFANYRSNGFSRDCWDNYHDYVALYGEGELMEELPLPRIPFARQIPMQLLLALQSHEDNFKLTKPAIAASGVDQFAGLCL